MRRTGIRSLASLALVGGMALAPAIASASVVSIAHKITWLPGLSTLPSGAHFDGPTSDTAQMTLSVMLNSSDPQGLSSFASAVSTPGNPLYHHFLHKGQFAGLFGASANQVAAVSGALRDAGLSVGALSANRLMLTVTGSAAAAASAFHTTFGNFTSANGDHGIVPTSKVGLDSSVSSYVAGVTGLNTLIRAHSTTVHTLDSGTATPQLGAGAACSTATTANSTRHEFLPADQAALYGLDRQYQNGFDGSGRTAAVIEFAGYNHSDLKAYLDCFGLTNAVTDVNVNGGPSSSSIDTGGIEVSLDIEEIAALAPGVAITNYQSPNDADGFSNTFTRAAVDDTASSISVSWGMCESHTSSAGLQVVLQQLAVQGQSVLVAAGDSGSETCASNAKPGGSSADYSLSVDDPANSPWVTAIGGLKVTSINPLEQSVWNSICGGNVPCAGGGGVSTIYPRPSWQVGPGVANISGRQLPDISVMGDPSTGFLVYFQGGFHGVGGTSIGAPIVAAMLAVGSQSCGATNLGFINPRLYQMGIAGTGIIDVTVGSNDMYDSGGYTAGTGFDMASGLGSPDPVSFLPDLCAQTSSATASNLYAGAHANWTVSVTTGATALVAGTGTLTLASVAAAGAFSANAADYTINGSPVTSAHLNTAHGVVLTVPTNVPAFSVVTLTAKNALNPTAVGLGTISVTDSAGFTATANLQLIASTVGALNLTSDASAGVGTNGALVSVAATTPGGSLLAGVTVTLKSSSKYAIIVPVIPVTNGFGIATFRVVDSNIESPRFTASSGSVTSASNSIRFTNTWVGASTTVAPKGDTIAATAVGSGSSNCGNVLRTTKGHLWSSKSSVLTALVSTSSVGSDATVTNGSGSSCVVAFVTTAGVPNVLVINGTHATKILANVTGAAKTAVVAPGVAIQNADVVVTTLTSSGHLVVAALPGAAASGVLSSSVVADDLTTLTSVGSVKTSGYSLAGALLASTGQLYVAYRNGLTVDEFTAPSVGGSWSSTDVADAASYYATGKGAVTGNVTLTGTTNGDGSISPAIYVHDVGLEVVEFTPDPSSSQYWLYKNITSSISALKTKTSIYVVNGSTRSLAVVVGSTVYVVSANGLSDQPWIAVAIKFTGAKALFVNAAGQFAATTAKGIVAFHS